MVLEIAAAATNTLPGLAQALAGLCSGTIGWLLMIGLMISGVIALWTHHPGVFIVDLGATLFVGFFVFNTAGAEQMVKSVSTIL